MRHPAALSQPGSLPNLRIMSPLSDIEIQRALGGLPGWSRKGETLAKTYHFASFPDAIAFIGRVAEIAEQMNHHPDIDIRYTNVHFLLSSHDAKGITNRDVELAKSIEELAAA
jgi:4a-hydroxytetrahydrobiopterin dehydratase